MNVGNRYIDFPMHIPNGPELADTATYIVRALEEEMHQMIETKCNCVRADLQYELDMCVQQMKYAFKDILEEHGHEVDMEEIDDIFRDRICVRLPF